MSYCVYAGISVDKPKETFPLKIDQETYITDKSGVLNPSNIISLVPSNLIKFYMTDGTMFTGIVKEIETSDKQIFKIYGEIMNKQNAGFGFVLTSEGVFAGAVVIRNSEETYTVQYSRQANGYVLVRALGKTAIPSSLKN